MDAIAIVFYGLGALVLLVTVLPLWRTDHWWVRICDFPRFQAAVIAVALLIALPAWRWPLSLSDWLLVAALLAALAWQASWVWRYLPGAPKQVASSRTPAGDPTCVALLTANVLQSNHETKRLLAMITRVDPDVILLVETDDWWMPRLVEGLQARYPHGLRHSLPTGYGMALFSRLELVEPTLRHVVDEGVPSIRTGVRLRSGDTVDVYGVHPPPPAPDQDSEERDTEMLLTGREIKSRGRPAIVMGDLNDVAWSRTTLELQIAGNLYDPRRGRGFYNTYHAKLPGFRYPLDYVFHTRHFKVAKLRVMPMFGSDHLPLLAVLCYQPTPEPKEPPS